MGQEERQDELQMAIKMLFFERTGDMFSLDKFERLRSAEEWAAAKKISGKSKKELAILFLQFQNKPIPTSLTQLDKGLREDAVHTFKCIQGFMGDAGFCYPLTLAQELVSLALKGGTALQTEAYVQLMKQLTNNPSPASERLGWQLVALMLQCFPPDPMLENYVANFLRVMSPLAPELYLKLCYAAIRCGPLRRVPKDVELPDILNAVEDKYRAMHDERASADGPPPLPTDGPPPLPTQGSAMSQGQVMSGKL